MSVVTGHTCNAGGYSGSRPKEERQRECPACRAYAELRGSTGQSAVGSGLRLHLGCSDDHKPGWINVDIAPPADQIFDLNMPWWPWEDSSVDAILANDCFEHIHGRHQDPWGKWRFPHPKIHVMNCAHRVLKPGGLLEFTVPCVMLSDGRVNPGAFTDPTHVSFWTMDDIYYFDEEWNNPQGERGRLGPAYGITALFRRRKWQLVEYGAGHERRSKIHAILEAVK